MKRTGKWNLAFPALVLTLISGALWASAAIQVPLGKQLQQDARSSAHSDRPIMLVFAARYCHYCELLEEEILRPMLLSGDYEQQVIMRKLLVDSDLPIEDFDGHQRKPAELSRRYGIKVTPTVLFVDAAGNELAERMVGINTVEMYGGYLDAAIEEARGKLVNRKRAQTTVVQPL